MKALPTARSMIAFSWRGWSPDFDVFCEKTRKNCAQIRLQARMRRLF
jgi:hypothetical protein